MASSQFFKALAAIFGGFVLTTFSPMPANARVAPAPPLFKFSFGTAPAAPGTIAITPQSLYSPTTGYGLEAGADLNQRDKPFLFSVALPEGNYQVTLRFGDAQTDSRTTVKAESRRLMIQDVKTAPGEFAARSFAVNIRTDALKSGQKVRLKAREAGVLHWDDKLTLEINGAKPRLQTLEIASAPNIPTLYIAGDSTVTDQPNEPWAGWGQMLPRFFDAGIAVANYAESGETLRAFVGEKRLEKILDSLKTGDYLFIQFGHNDMKERDEGIGAFTSYSDSLRAMIAAAKNAGATPVLLTPMERRRFDANGKSEATLGDYPAAVRRVAREEKVPLIDLNALSTRFYQALGPEGSKKAFVHFAANTFPGQSVALRDDTHFNPYGAFQLARGVVEAIKTVAPELAKHLQSDVSAFDPSQPDAPETWDVPASPSLEMTKPDGN